MAAPIHQYLLPRTISAAALNALFASHRIAPSGKPVLLERTTYDSFDWRLYAAGFVLDYEDETMASRLVLRRVGSPVSVAAIDARSPPRFAADCPASVLRNRIDALLDGRALLPVAQVRLRLRRYDAKDSDGRTVLRVSIEEGVARRPNHPRGRRLGRCVRLDPMPGLDVIGHPFGSALIGLGAIPVATDPLHLVLSAHERQPLAYNARPRPQLSAAFPAGHATATMLSAYFDVAVANVQGILDDIDPEFLHDFRTAMRRSRSIALNMRGVIPDAERRALKAAFAWISALTGELRDLDVFSANWPQVVRRLYGLPADDLPAIAALLATRRATALEKVRRDLQSRRWRTFATKWPRFLAKLGTGKTGGRAAMQPVTLVASRSIERLRRELFPFVHGIDPAGPIEQFHELRKLAKKLRYVIEAFASLYPAAELARPLADLKRLQEGLGSLYDLHVQYQKVLGLSLAAQATDGVGPGVSESLTHAVAEIRAKMSSRRLSVIRDLKEFDRPRTVKRFAKLNLAG